MRFLTNLLVFPFYCLMGLLAFLMVGALFYGSAAHASPFFTLLFFLLLARAVLHARRRRAWAITGYLEQAVRLNLPLPAMLQAAARSERGRLRVGLRGLASGVANGVPLADAVRRHTPEITEERRRWIAAGQGVGRLSPVLTSMRQRDLRALRTSKAGTGLTLGYAGALTGALALAVSFISVVILPKYVEIFDDFDIVLPAITLQLFGVREALGPMTPGIVGGVVLLALMGACFYAIFHWDMADPLSAPASWLVDAVRWRLPLAGAVARHRAWARGFELAAEALNAGAPLPDALRVAGTAVGPRAARGALASVAASLEQGADLRAAVGASRLPRLARGVLTAGGSAVELPGTLRFLSSYHDERQANAAVNLRSVWVPLVMLAVAATVAWFVVALLFPLVRLIESVTPQWAVL